MPNPLQIDGKIFNANKQLLVSQAYFVGLHGSTAHSIYD